jgi:hypothetical protein
MRDATAIINKYTLCFSRLDNFTLYIARYMRGTFRARVRGARTRLGYRFSRDPRPVAFVSLYFVVSKCDFCSRFFSIWSIWSDKLIRCSIFLMYCMIVLRCWVTSTGIVLWLSPWSYHKRTFSANGDKSLMKVRADNFEKNLNDREKIILSKVWWVL